MKGTVPQQCRVFFELSGGQFSLAQWKKSSGALALRFVSNAELHARVVE
jgi:hypothetical protein